MTRIHFNDVVTRDGFQIEPNFIPTEDKVKLVDSLGAFEKTSFSWIVRSKGPVQLKAGAPHAGFATQTVTF